MKCAVGLLFDNNLDYVVNALAWRVHCEDGLGIKCRRLPPHVSLKQPFEIGDSNRLDGLVATLEGFIARIDPVPIEFGPLGSWESILGYPARPESWLRSQHIALNAMLAEQLDDPSAPFDGDAYRFHLTVAAGRVEPEIARLAAVRHGGTVLAPAVPTRLGIFTYSQEPASGEWQYLCFRSLSLQSYRA